METLFEKKIYTFGGAVRASLTLALAIGFAVTCVVLVGVRDSGDSDTQDLISLFGIGALVVGALALYLFYKAKVLFQIRRMETGKLRINVHDPREKKEIDPPWAIDYGFERVEVGPPGTPKVKRLILNFYKNNQLVLKLQEDRGAVHSAPHGWPETHHHFKNCSEYPLYKHIDYQGSELENIVNLLS